MWQAEQTVYEVDRKVNGLVKVNDHMIEFRAGIVNLEQNMFSLHKICF